MRRAQTPSSREDFDRAIAGDGLEAVFQPIVSLTHGSIVAFEALARWSHLNEVRRDDIFSYASRTGQAAELERRCIEAALGGATDAGLPDASALFVNCEATTPFLSRSDSAILAHGAAHYQVVFEVTERSLLTHPPDLLRKVVALREEGFAVALDDVGTDMNALALLDVLAPDVIKLDLTLVQSQPRYQQARTWAAVLAHHERAGAHVLAEGIETAEHLERARALGATLGQGFLFGRPGPLSRDTPTDVPWPPIRTQHPFVDFGSPFDAVATPGTSQRGVEALPVRQHRRDTVIALSRYIAQQALEAKDPPIVLTALQRADYFIGETRTIHEQLAAHCPLVVVFGQDVAEDLGCGIRGVRFRPDDSLHNQWIVLALGANTSSAMVTREAADQHDTSSDRDRLYDVVYSNDRAWVTRVARQLLSRMLTLHAS